VSEATEVVGITGLKKPDSFESGFNNLIHKLAKSTKTTATAATTETAKTA
jgi:hypothetical protein